ncbi:MAG: hypothetical protein J3R72DRAFT_163613 [Linnemannia gamsii]|nr:MAG: hypothetical protein J3R72DRAFT_163613 [Linnemannia gamsii]
MSPSTSLFLFLLPTLYNILYPARLPCASLSFFCCCPIDSLLSSFTIDIEHSQSTKTSKNNNSPLFFLPFFSPPYMSFSCPKIIPAL